MIHAFKANPLRGVCGVPPGPGIGWVSAYTDDKHTSDCPECRRILGMTLGPQDPRPTPPPERSVAPDPQPAGRVTRDELR